VAKKITENSKFCRYCGEKNDDKSNKEVVKNNKRFYLTSFRNFWAILWVITILVFILTIVIVTKFDESNVNLLNNILLFKFFIFNICLGVISFISIFFTKIIPRKTIPKFIRYGFIFLFFYLIINPAVFAVEGYKAKTNEEYKNKYYKSEIPTPTPIPQDSTEKLLKDLNDYRSEQKLSTVTLDEEMCKVAERLVKKENLTGVLKESDYIDLCPKCNGIGYAFVENYPLNNVFPKFKDLNETKKVIDLKGYKYACFVISGQKVLLFIGNKSSTSKTNTVATNNSNNLECIGPDGKHFNTTMDECKKLADKWNKPLDYMLDCNIHPDCGGGTVRMSYSQCMKPCSGLPNKTNNTTTNNSPPVVITSTQNNSSKVAFQATETSIKGTYYCYDNKVNEMVTQQSFVKSYRELYENCINSSSNKSVYDNCWYDTCAGLSDTSSCSKICYDNAYINCPDYYKTYLSERSKLDNMRWSNCP